MGDQLSAMHDSAKATKTALRADQRAWLYGRVGIDPKTIKDTEPLVAFAEIVNNGKTPAIDVHICTGLQIVPSSDSPNFLNTEACEHEEVINKRTAFSSFATIGAVIPHDPKQVPATFGKEIISHRQYLDLEHGDAYIAMYVLLTYKDIFGINRWTRHCSFTSLAGVSYAASRCTGWSSVDQTEQ
jgi:hypothetical protein